MEFPLSKNRMSILPLNLKGKLIVALVVHPHGLEYLQSHDPQPFNLGKVIEPLGLDSCTHAHDVEFLVCFEEDPSALIAELQKVVDGQANENQGSEAVLRHLRRGRKIDPKDVGLAAAIAQAAKGPAN